MALEYTVPKDHFDGTIIGCEWSEGRWPGKGALDFKRPGDCVRLQAPGEYQSLTYLAWVRIDAFEQQYTALMLTDSYDNEAAHWQLHEGRMLLGVQRTNQGKGHNYYSESCLGPDQFGEWIQLATVYNHRSRTVTHYRNGQSATPENLRYPPTALRLGHVEIGNWGRAAPGVWPETVVRNFNGRIDEFALFHEALSAPEIARWYEIGKPYP